MKRVGVVALVVMAGGVAAANAADPPMPVLREPVLVALWSWSGLYAGAHLGGGFTAWKAAGGPIEKVEKKT